MDDKPTTVMVVHPKKRDIMTIIEGIVAVIGIALILAGCIAFAIIGKLFEGIR